MSISQRDRIVGLVLLTIALIWTGLVYETIPAGDPDTVGPRAFPLLLGIVLAGLSAIMVARAFAMREEAPRHDPAEPPQPAVSWLEAKMAGGVFLFIVLYGFFLERLGFRIATAALVAAAMIGPLKIRNPILIILFSVGMAVGCWLVFNKLLGAYMPYGSWTSMA